LTGDGGDELFLGYDQDKFLMMGYRLRHIPRFLRKESYYAFQNIPKFFLNKIYKYSGVTGKKMFKRYKKFIENIKENKAKSLLEVVSVLDEEERKQLFKEYEPANYYDEINNRFFKNKNDFLNQVLYHNYKWYLPEDLLIKPDRMCMAFSIEARTPFLDHNFVNFSFTIPPQFKLKRMTKKYILTKSMKNILPKKIIKRKKQPFQVPIDQWILKDLKPTFKRFLSKDIIDKYKFFNYNYIEKIFKNYNKGTLFYGRQLWTLLTFQIWHKIYIERENLKKII
jgi:asparagine synthase (glutamine-hydrolysing)